MSSDSFSSSSSSSDESVSSGHLVSDRARNKKSQWDFSLDPYVPVQLATKSSVADPNSVPTIPPDSIPEKITPASMPTKRKLRRSSTSSLVCSRIGEKDYQDKLSRHGIQRTKLKN